MIEYEREYIEKDRDVKVEEIKNLKIKLYAETSQTLNGVQLQAKWERCVGKISVLERSIKQAEDKATETAKNTKQEQDDLIKQLEDLKSELTEKQTVIDTYKSTVEQLEKDDKKNQRVIKSLETSKETKIKSLEKEKEGLTA